MLVVYAGRKCIFLIETDTSGNAFLSPISMQISHSSCRDNSYTACPHFSAKQPTHYFTTLLFSFVATYTVLVYISSYVIIMPRCACAEGIR